MEFKHNQELYSISKRNGEWKVNSTIYMYKGISEDGYNVHIIDEKKAYLALSTKYIISKKLTEVFTSNENAEKEVNKRNIN